MASCSPRRMRTSRFCSRPRLPRRSRMRVIMKRAPGY
jgi:hypothetical protein